MAFNEKKFYLMSQGYGQTSGRRLYSYDDHDSTVAEMKASGFFDDASPALRIDDLLFLSASDDRELAYVASLAPVTIVDLVTASSGTIPDGSITNAKLADGAVSGAKVAALGISAGKYAAASIATADVAPLAITSGLLAASSVSGDKIAPLGIPTGAYAAGSIATADIATSAITGPLINNGSITSSKIGNGTLLLADMATEVTDKLVSHSVIHTTVGGSATEAIALAGVTATDVCQVGLHTSPIGGKTIISYACEAGAVSVVFSGDPSTTHKLNILVTKPTA
jgi:hypothetical protein